MDVKDKARLLTNLLDQWDDCQKCELAAKRSNIVFPAGNPSADLAIIGIGPGEQEDLQGAPFVGPSGDILTDYLVDARLVENDILILNLVGCRPYDVHTDATRGKIISENRDPTKIELDACKELWQRALYICDPLLIMALGKPTARELTRKPVTMTTDVGKMRTCTIPGLAGPITYPVIINYHPAFLARSGDTYKGGPWHRSAVVWRRAAVYLDRLRHAYYETPIPNRGFTDEDLRWT